MNGWLLQDFKTASGEWVLRTEGMRERGELEDPLTLRMVNDQIMKLERVWLLPQVSHTTGSNCHVSSLELGSGGAAEPRVDRWVFSAV